MATDTGYIVYELDFRNGSYLTKSSPEETGVSIHTLDANDYILGDASQREAFTTGDSINGNTTFTYKGTASTSETQGFYATAGGKTYYFSKSEPSRGQVVNVNPDTAGPGGHDHAICFFPGTLIRTPEGEVAVEALRAGDLVLTADGRAVPVRWMARQTVSPFFADPLRTLPIRIRAGALGEGLPRRDLLVSPGHAMFVGGVLVQAGALVNGTTVLREHNVPPTFTYWHVEVADHSLILAEGAPAETFVDNVDREAFDNWDEYLAILGEDVPIPEMDLPRAKSHRQVPVAVRRLLAERAAVLGAASAAA